MACAYCYVPRRKGFANPITTFVNIEAIMRAMAGTPASCPAAGPEPSQVDPHLCVYEIGENGDCSADALLSDNLRDLVAMFRLLPNAKATFATKFVNRALLAYDPQRKTRLRFSLMPQRMSTLVDMRTSRIEERIAAVNDFVAAGYEVHLNFSPVIVYEGWQEDYRGVVRAGGRRAGPGRQGATRLRSHFPDAQRRAPRGEHALASQGRRRALAARPPGGQNQQHRRRERPLPPRLQGPAGGGISRRWPRRHLPYCPIRYAF